MGVISQTMPGGGIVRGRKRVGPGVARIANAAEIANEFDVPHKVAVALWEEVGGVEACRDASKEELQEVNGVGPTRADKVHTYVDGQPTLVVPNVEDNNE